MTRRRAAHPLVVVAVGVLVAALPPTPTAGHQTGASIHTSSTDALPPRTIVGIVYDAKSGQGLAGAQVVIGETDAGAVADSFGRFRIAAPSDGPQSIVVRLIGYKEYESRIHVAPGRGLAVQIGIEQTEIHVCGLVVCAGRYGCYAVEAIVRDLVTGTAPDGPVSLTVTGPSARDSMSDQAVPEASFLHLGAAGELADRGPYVVEVRAPGYVPWRRSNVGRDACGRVVGNPIRVWLLRRQ